VRNIVAVLVGIAIASSAIADEVFVSSIPGTGNQAFGGSLAQSFTVGADPLTVHSVGVYDSAGNGLALPIAFALWTGGSGDVGASRTLRLATVFVAGTGTLEGSHRFIDLFTPITLDPGASYTVVAYGYGVPETAYNEEVGGVAIGFSTAGLTVGDGGFHATAGTNPNLFSWTSSTHFGMASFQYTVDAAPIPEPSSIVLVALAAIVVVVRYRVPLSRAR
jgi:hypothetical protein